MNNQYNTYIDDKSIIERLLSYNWIVIKNTWTDCPENIYNKIKEDIVKDYFLGNNPKYNKRVINYE